MVGDLLVVLKIQILNLLEVGTGDILTLTVGTPGIWFMAACMFWWLFRFILWSKEFLHPYLALGVYGKTL